MEINNADDLQRAIEADELADKLEAARGTTSDLPDFTPWSDGEMVVSMSVQEYAKAHGIQPQLIYYYIRRKRIKLHPCGECGRKVIDIEDADKVFAKKEDK